MTRHALDPVAFVGGALFTILGGFALLGGDVAKVNGGWVWPAMLAAAGLALMALTARSLVARRPRHSVSPAVPHAASAEPGAFLTQPGAEPAAPEAFLSEPGGESAEPGAFLTEPHPASADPGADVLPEPDVPPGGPDAPGAGDGG